MKKNNFIKKWENSIQNIDCFEGFKKIPENSVDLIIADPPYNLSKGKPLKWDNSVKLNGMGGNWDKVLAHWDNMTFQEYWDFTQMWLSESKRILKPTGSIWVYGTYHNIGIINVLFQKLKIEILNEIIWFKRNSFPNLRGRRFTASHENILWGHVGEKKRKYLFKYNDIKEMECPEDLIKKAGRQMRTVWDIPNNKKPEELKFGKHPTQKPIRVCKRMILSTTDENDMILVPFSGSGTECVSALQLQRKFIGFEIDKKYVDIANKRLKYEESKGKQIRLV